MSLEVKGYLNDCKDLVQDQLKDNETRKTISEAIVGFLTTGIRSLPDASKSVSSFGISIGLGLLGVGLAKKYRRSGPARAIATVFGTDVTKLDTQFVLDKLKGNARF